MLFLLFVNLERASVSLLMLTLVTKGTTVIRLG